MRAFIFISTFFFATVLKGQGVDKTYVDNWIKAADSSFAVDSVRVYFVNGNYLTSYDTVALATSLSEIDIDKIAYIDYSDLLTCGYEPGEGTISIGTIKQKDINVIKYNLRQALNLFVDKYISPSQNILSFAKDPAVIVDYRPVSHTQVQKVLKKLKPEDIYDIRINYSRVPAAIYGQNSKNGLVQIWTKRIIK